jgi:PAS domain S-box-containing protein
MRPVAFFIMESINMPKMTLIQRFSFLCFIALVFFGVGFGWISSTIMERKFLMRSKQTTANIVSGNVREHFKSNDFRSPKIGSDYDNFFEKMRHISLGPNIERIKIWNKEKYVVWSDDRRLIGKHFPENEALDIALSGKIVSEAGFREKTEHLFEQQFETLHEIYIPIRFKSNIDIETVFEIYQNLNSLYIDIFQQKKVIWTSTILGFTFLYLILIGIISSASRRIESQSRKVAQSEERYRTLVQSAQDGIISIDHTGEIALLNEAAAQMFGYKEEELMNQPFTDLVPEKYNEKHQSEMVCFFNICETPIFGEVIEYVGIRKSGQRFPLEMCLSISRTSNFPTVTAIIRDITERKAIKESLNLAREIQQNLIPRDIPRINGLDIAAKIIYCEETGGDYYDFVEFGVQDQGKLGVVLGDVSGHGISSALLMATVRSSVRQRSFIPGSLSTIVSDVNRQLVHDVKDSSQFITLFFLIINPKNQSLLWVRAGHDPGLFFDPRTNTFENLKGLGLALGVDKNWEYEENKKFGLEKGQIIVLGTDGVWEARNSQGKMFRKESVYEIIQQYNSKSANDIMEAIIKTLRQFQEGTKLEDDMTLVIIKINDDF